MDRKKWIAMAMSGMLVAAVVSGCSSSKNEGAESLQGSPSSPAASASGAESSVPAETISEDIEVWSVNNGYKEVTKGSPMYNFYKEKLGVGIIQPYVEWNGGTTYQQQLNLKIVANEMPDMFLPVNGMEYDLAKNGAILDLTDLLPKQAPHLWEDIPEEVWDVIKSYDPNGQGRIYSIPSIFDYGKTGAMIRKDWLDKLNLPIPTTQEELVNVLKAFRDNDPNGNGEKDEIPTGGRQEGRWMDYLFAMYGIAMQEGYPDWDIYDGELTYSAVTPNMKDALVFIRDLYKQGLLDKETFLNNKATWDGKVGTGKVGVYFHLVDAASDYLENIEKVTGVKGDYTVIPPISAPGYEAFYTMKRINSQNWVLKNQKDTAKINAAMKVLDGYGDQSKWNDLYFGVEGMHYDMQDGVPTKKPEDKSVMENIVLSPFYDISVLDYYLKMFEEVSKDPTRKWAIVQDVRNLKDNQKYVKAIAGDGLPSSIYADYPDIQNRTLYIEYITKIIVGEYPIEKFDEFVDKWYKSGGEAVTQASREWYAKVKA